MSKKMFAVCGLDCAQCPAYIALKNDDNALREKTAIEWTANYGHSFRVEDINCVGCCVQTGIHGGYCSACPVRLCALVKNIANCNVCDDFASCKTRQEFEQQTGLNIKNNFAAE